MSNDQQADGIITVATLTVSESRAEGRAEDINGLVLKKLVEDAGMEVVATQTVPDDQELIGAIMRPGGHIAAVLSYGLAIAQVDSYASRRKK